MEGDGGVEGFLGGGGVKIVKVQRSRSGSGWVFFWLESSWTGKPHVKGYLSGTGETDTQQKFAIPQTQKIPSILQVMAPQDANDS